MQAKGSHFLLGRHQHSSSQQLTSSFFTERSIQGSSSNLRQYLSKNQTTTTQHPTAAASLNYSLPRIQVPEDPSSSSTTRLAGQGSEILLDWLVGKTSTVVPEPISSYQNNHRSRDCRSDGNIPPQLMRLPQSRLSSRERDSLVSIPQSNNTIQAPRSRRLVQRDIHSNYSVESQPSLNDSSPGGGGNEISLDNHHRFKQQTTTSSTIPSELTIPSSALIHHSTPYVSPSSNALKSILMKSSESSSANSIPTTLTATPAASLSRKSMFKPRKNMLQMWMNENSQLNEGSLESVEESSACQEDCPVILAHPPNLPSLPDISNTGVLPTKSFSRINTNMMYPSGNNSTTASPPSDYSATAVAAKFLNFSSVTESRIDDKWKVDTLKDQPHQLRSIQRAHTEVTPTTISQHPMVFSSYIQGTSPVPQTSGKALSTPTSFSSPLTQVQRKSIQNEERILQQERVQQQQEQQQQQQQQQQTKSSQQTGVTYMYQGSPSNSSSGISTPQNSRTVLKSALKNKQVDTSSQSLSSFISFKSTVRPRQNLSEAETSTETSQSIKNSFLARNLYSDRSTDYILADQSQYSLPSSGKIPSATAVGGVKHKVKKVTFLERVQVFNLHTQASSITPLSKQSRQP